MIIPNVPNMIKDEIVAAIQNKEGTENTPKRACMGPASLDARTPVDFTTKNSNKLFSRLRLPQDF